MVFPNITIAFGCARSFVLVNPSEIYAIEKITNRGDPLCWNFPAVDSCHVFSGRVFDVGGRMLPAGCDWAQIGGNTLLLNRPVDVAPFPLA
jgi:hypothetical protein